MKQFSTYSVKIRHYNHIFGKTVSLYRDTVDFFIRVCLDEWEALSSRNGVFQQQYIESLCHQTKKNTDVRYPDFDRKFYKFPSYLRRSAIQEAIGKVSSYKSNLRNWSEQGSDTRGSRPSLPRAGFVYPCMYRDNMYKQTGAYTAKIKIYIRNTWDWIEVQLRKSDMDYISRHCSGRKACAPTLQKRGKEWFLDFPFEEQTPLAETDIFDRTILSVDLGILTAATVSVMRSDGTVLGRYFCKLPKEYDSLTHAINRIKKAQQHGNRKTPRLWARARGINQDIAVKTAHFIRDIAVLHQADVIVFEHLNFSGKKRGSKKQRLHLWKSQAVQAMVTAKAHRLGIRISHVCAWGTSRLAYDGSGNVLRGNKAGLPVYSLCRFPTGKIYNCDLSAAYNIGSRYFVREILKSLSPKDRLAIEAKVPQLTKRSTCTLSSLINLNAELISMK